MGTRTWLSRQDGRCQNEVRRSELAAGSLRDAGRENAQRRGGRRSPVPRSWPQGWAPRCPHLPRATLAAARGLPAQTSSGCPWPRYAGLGAEDKNHREGNQPCLHGSRQLRGRVWLAGKTRRELTRYHERHFTNVNSSLLLSFLCR